MVDINTYTVAVIVDLCNMWTFDPAVIFDSTRLGDSTVAKKPLRDFWARRGGGQLFDMGGSTVTYGTTQWLSIYKCACMCVDRSRHNRNKGAMTKCVHSDAYLDLAPLIPLCLERPTHKYVFALISLAIPSNITFWNVLYLNCTNTLYTSITVHSTYMQL